MNERTNTRCRQIPLRPHRISTRRIGFRSQPTARLQLGNGQVDAQRQPYSVAESGSIGASGSL
jgi:hypothetical protein